MWVKLRTIVAGPDFAGQPGQVLELPDKVAAGLVAGGYAERSAPPEPEVAPLSPSEVKRVRALVGNETATAPDADERAVVPHGKGKKHPAEG